MSIIGGGTETAQISLHKHQKGAYIQYIALQVFWATYPTKVWVIIF